MANQPFTDVLIMPGTGNTANLSSMICNAPKAAPNQYTNVSRYPGLQTQPTGIGEFNLLTNRYSSNITIIISG